MASAANLGVQLHQDSILISDDVKAVCDLFDLPYAGCIGAGSMILAVDPSQENTLQQAFETAGIACAGIGGFTPDPKQKELISGENTGLLPYFDTDPYWAAFFEALNRGWK